MTLLACLGRAARFIVSQLRRGVNVAALALVVHEVRGADISKTPRPIDVDRSGVVFTAILPLNSSAV